MSNKIENEKMVFDDITANLVSNHNDVSEGKMMSSPGVRYKNKVFVFYHDHSMIFKLGKGYDIKSEGVENYSFLNPFKNKPAMKGWFVVPSSEIEKWQTLAEKALNEMKTELRGH